MTQANTSINSDFDYLKIYESGLITMSTGAGGADTTFPSEPDPGGQPAGVFVIPNTTGSVPIVRTFFDPAKNGVWYSTKAYIVPATIKPVVKTLASATEVKLILVADAVATDIPVYYRVYNLGDTSITNDNAIDKIFAKDSGSVTVPGQVDPFTPGQTIVTIPHTAGEVPLWSVQFSQDNINWYPEGIAILGPPDLGSGPPGGPYSRYYDRTAYTMATSTNIQIVLQNLYPSSTTMYYRYTLDYRT